MLLQLSSLVLSLGLGPAPSGSIQIDLGRGPVTVHIPAAYDPSSPVPLLLLLHGYGADGPSQESYMQFGPLVDSQGFLYAYPNGTVDPWGSRYWNGTDACCDFADSGVDDSGYLRALIDEIKGQFSVDPLRVHLVGHSNGSFMANRMACEHSEVIASIAGLAGPTFKDPGACLPSDPVHVLHMHGTADDVILYGGGTLLGVPYPGAVESVAQWVTHNGCSPTPDTSAPPLDLDSSVPGAETTRTRFEASCPAGGSVERWDMAGVGHGPALVPGFAAEVVAWLYAHQKPEIGRAYCTSSTHSGGFEARIAAWGSESLAAGNLTLVASNAPRDVFGIFFQGDQQVSSPLGDGLLCAGGAIQRIESALFTGVAGEAIQRLDFGAPYAAGYAPGTPVHYQFWFRDTAAGGSGFNLSDARSVLYQP